MYADRDPNPNPPPVGTQFIMTLVILVVLGLVWVLFYGLTHGWFKPIPV